MRRLTVAREAGVELVPPAPGEIHTGTRRLSWEQVQAESGSVDSYLHGEYVFLARAAGGPRQQAARIRVTRHGLSLSPALVAQLPEPLRRVRVGVDVPRRLLTLVPVAAEDLKGGHAVTRHQRQGKRSCAWTVTNANVGSWLLAQGVPTGVDIPARWQPQTQSIVGRWPA